MASSAHGGNEQENGMGRQDEQSAPLAFPKARTQPSKADKRSAAVALIAERVDTSDHQTAVYMGRAAAYLATHHPSVWADRLLAACNTFRNCLRHKEGRSTRVARTRVKALLEENGV